MAIEDHMNPDHSRHGVEPNRAQPERMEMPWRIRLHLRRILAIPLIRGRFAAAGVRWGTGWQVFGSPIIQRHRGSRIHIGDGLSLRSWPRSNPLSPSHPVVLSTRAEGALITIGSRFGMTGGSIVAAAQVAIGDDVLIGADCVIADNDFHALSASARRRDAEPMAEPVTIGDDVFIGMGSVVLKGVTIGERSVIGAGSVVASDIPADVIAAGNPARVIRRLDG